MHGCHPSDVAATSSPLNQPHGSISSKFSSSVKVLNTPCESSSAVDSSSLRGNYRQNAVAATQASHGMMDDVQPPSRIAPDPNQQAPAAGHAPLQVGEEQLQPARLHDRSHELLRGLLRGAFPHGVLVR
jgi:hypothetical protein